MCTSSWFQALGPATVNARVPKCVTEEQTTRSPRVADQSVCVLLTDVTSRHVTNPRYLAVLRRMERLLAYGELANKSSTTTCPLYSSKQALEVTRIGVNECPRQSPSRSKMKARRTTWRELRVARPRYFLTKP